MSGERIAVSLVLFVILLSICVYLFEAFIPLSKNMDFRDACRSYLVKMEQQSGLSENDQNQLKVKLENMGFVDVTINAPQHVKFGQLITLKVEGIYTMMNLSGIFQRTKKEYHMSYQRDVMARKVINE